MKTKDQRDKVYAWEKQVLQSTDLETACPKVNDIDQFISQVWDKLELTIGKPTWSLWDGIKCDYDRDTHHIRLNKEWGVYSCVILHEIAHSIVPNCEGHGADFVGCISTLYSTFCGVNRKYMWQATREFNIGINEAWQEEKYIPRYTVTFRENI